MIHEELFVGAVSVVLGVLAITAAISNGEVYYQITKIRWIEGVGGRFVERGARVREQRLALVGGTDIDLEGQTQQAPRSRGLEGASFHDLSLQPFTCPQPGGGRTILGQATLKDYQIWGSALGDPRVTSWAGLRIRR